MSKKEELRPVVVQILDTCVEICEVPIWSLPFKMPELQEKLQTLLIIAGISKMPPQAHKEL